jgi:ribosomal protein S18 acetylase RimI-like enzyme
MSLQPSDATCQAEMIHEEVVIQIVPPDGPLAQRALWSYTDDIVSRYYGRPATHDEVAAVLRDDPSDDLRFPQGLFLVALHGGAVVGCSGLRLLRDGVGEVKRVHVAVYARGQGLGTHLMGELERLAREHGRSVLRLDTRHDLVEARRLYARLGYREVPAFNAGPYGEHWFEKSLL